MRSNWRSQEADGRPPVLALVLVSLLAVLTSLTMAFIFGPKIFEHALVSLILITLIAFLTTFFTAVTYGEYLSRPILAVVMVVIQLLALLGWMGCQGISLTLLHEPLKLSTVCIAWFIAALTAGLIPVGFTETLCRLSRPPYRKPIGIKMSGNNAFEEAFEESWGRLLMPIEETKGWNYSFWEQEWNRWRTIIVTLFLVVFALAIIGSHLRQEPISLFQLELLILSVFATCLLLLTHGYRLYKRAVWNGESLDTHQFRSKDWVRWTGYLLAIVFLVSLILPAGYGISMNGGGATHISRPQDIVAFKEHDQQDATGLMDIVLGNALGGTLLAFMVLIILAVVIFPFVVFGGVFYNFDSRKLSVFAHIVKKFMAFWRSFRQEIIRLGQELFSSYSSDRLNSDSDKRTSLNRVTYSWGKGSRAVIRRGYYRLVTHGQEHGMVLRKCQTSREIGESLKNLVDGQDESIDHVTNIYQEARYGPVSPDSDDVKVFERIRRTIQEKLSCGLTTNKN